TRSASTCRAARSMPPTLRRSSPRATAMKSEREVFRTGGGAEDLAGYARAVRTGSWISVSGTAPAGRGDVREQTLDAFRLALDAVNHFDGSVENDARTRIFLAAGC